MLLSRSPKLLSQDSDLDVLRGRPEWEEALSRFKGEMTTSMRYDLIGELRSPFRFFRFWALGGLSIGAGVGLVFIVASIVKAVNSEFLLCPLMHRTAVSAGDPVQEPLRNLAINGIALAVLSVLFYRDYQSREKEKAKIEREEKLGTLKVCSQMPNDLTESELHRWRDPLEKQYHCPS